MNDNLFEIKNLNVYSKGNKIVDNLNFKIKKNTILGIVGEVAAASKAAKYWSTRGGFKST